MLWSFRLFYEKISRLGVLRSFEGKIFLCGRNRRPQKYLLYFQAEIVSVEEKIPSKPCKSLCVAALLCLFFYFVILSGAQRSRRIRILPKKRIGRVTDSPVRSSAGAWKPGGPHASLLTGPE